MKITKALILIGVCGTAAALIFPIFSKHEPQKTVPTHNQEPVQISREQVEEFRKLDSIYCINYGRKDAPVKIIEFFSFQCPHCVRLFREDFGNIKEELIDTGKVHFEFHPVPQDLPTVQAMICFEQLEENEKCLFLEVMFEEATPSDPELMSTLMMTAMNVFKKPLDKLKDHQFLQDHHVFEAIYPFLKQEKIFAVPTVEINGRLFSKEIPTYQFIKSFIED